MHEYCTLEKKRPVKAEFWIGGKNYDRVREDHILELSMSSDFGVLQSLEKVVKLARQEGSWKFSVCLLNQALETENVKDSYPSVPFIPRDHLVPNDRLQLTIIRPIRIRCGVLVPCPYGTPRSSFPGGWPTSGCCWQMWEDKPWTPCARRGVITPHWVVSSLRDSPTIYRLPGTHVPGSGLSPSGLPSSAAEAAFLAPLCGTAEAVP